MSVLHGVVLVSFYRFTDASDLQLLVAVAFQAVTSVLFFGLILIDLLRRSATSTQGSVPPPSPRRSEVLHTLVAIPADYAVLCLCFLLLGWQPGFRAAYSTMFVLDLVYLLAALARWWRQVRAMDLAGQE